jgi:hypothetical protein
LAISKRLCEYFLCSEKYVSFILEGFVSVSPTDLQLGREALLGKQVCTDFGRFPISNPKSRISSEQHEIQSSFDPDEFVDNLRLERYINPSKDGHPANSVAGRAYYLVRPFLPVKVRRHLQRARLNSWRDLKFPQWPVDRTVDHTMATLLLSSLRAHGLSKIPFIWFWPDGATAAAVITHDVETYVGRDSCAAMMDIDDSFGFKAAFEVVPETRYEVTPSYLNSIRERGFEIAVHDLNHDGNLFRDQKTFYERVSKINAYGQRFGAEGFRAAVLYRNQEWYGALDFSYDTSVPNTARLDPQRGGCCTVLPYFIDRLIELPVTITQDYSLFHILNDYSIDLWKQQIEFILESHGLINGIIHPDYIVSSRERVVFENLLAHLAKLREERGIWTALPKDVARWWRQRSKMKLVEDESGVRIEGDGKERARVAYAFEENGRLEIEVSPAQAGYLVEHSN